jgi:hypothetical protein
MRTRNGYSAVGVLVVVWLVIGVIAAVQRDYFKGSSETCAKASTSRSQSSQAR